MLTPFHYAFVQRGAVELVLLAVGAGVLGTWIVLRGLAFFSHGVATAAFPGLVLAAGLGFAAPLGAFGAALVFALGVERLGHRRRQGHDTLTALVLVGALALGVILASDVFHSRSNVETLLFGSVLAVGDWDLAFAGAVSALVVLVALVFAGRWLAVGFDAATARALGVRGALTDALLLLTIALAVTSALAAVGTMLTSALYVVPAATTRLWISRLRPWQVASVALAALEGVAGLWLSVEANVPPGAAIAVIAGGVFALTAVARAKPRLLLAGATALLLAGCGGSGAHRGPQDVRTRQHSLRAGAAAARPLAAALLRSRPSRRAQARHEPRRLRLLRCALPDHDRRRGRPVTDDAGATVGRRSRPADRADPPR